MYDMWTPEPAGSSSAMDPGVSYETTPELNTLRCERRGMKHSTAGSECLFLPALEHVDYQQWRLRAPGGGPQESPFNMLVSRVVWLFPM